MANNNLTIDMITNACLDVLHQKLNFVGNIITDYDDDFADDGAKIGDSIRIRLPIQPATGAGPPIATGTGADSLQSKVSLTLNPQRHVPMRFTFKEMTLDIDDFRERHIVPAMSKLAAMIESDALSMIDEVSNTVSAGTKVEFAAILQRRVKRGKEMGTQDIRYD